MVLSASEDLLCIECLPYPTVIYLVYLYHKTTGYLAV